MYALLIALIVTTLPMPDSGASMSGNDDTQMLPSQRPLKGYKCVERDAQTRIINFGSYYGSFPMPAQTSAEEQGGMFCLGSCIRGVNVEPFRECEPQRDSECVPEIGFVRILVTEKADCIIFRDRSCVCVLYVPVPPDEQVIDVVPIPNACGGS